MEKIITVDLRGCKKAYANSVTQWDHGYKLHIIGLSDFGGSVEVHFSLSEVGGEAPRSIAEVTEDGLTVEFPNFLLEKEHIGNYYAYAFIYPATADFGQTVKTIIFPVMGRPKPADWSGKNDPDIIAQLNEKIEKKADKATTLSGYGIKDAYTKKEVDKLIEGASEGYTDEEINAFLSKKVDKVEGKDLSSNDFTDELKAKLGNAASKDDLNAAKTELNKNIGLSEARANEKIENSAEELTEYINEVGEAETAERKGAIAETQKEAKNLYANAIKATASGEVIRVDDVSPAEHTARAKISGKNLLNYPYYPFSVEKVGVTIIGNKDGSITLNGTATASWNVGFFGSELATTTLEKGVYTFSLKNGDVSKCYLVLGGNSSKIEYMYGTNITFTMTEKGQIGYCLLQIVPGATFDNLTVYPMLEKGDTATEYEMYIPPESVAVTRCGKNLVTNMGKSTEGKGIEWKINTDGTVTANGTAETQCILNFDVLGCAKALIGKTVTLSGCPSGGAINTAYSVVQRNYGQFDIGNGKTFVIDNNNFTAWGLRIDKGITVDNLVFKPQLELAGEVTNYAPYGEIETYTPEADGTVNITSLAPTMTLLTDTAGVNIELEYNQDSNKALGNVKDDIKELDRVTTEIAGAKADKGTTLKDYGITDSYTKAEVEEYIETTILGGAW